MSARTLDLLGKMAIDIAKGCLFGAIANKAGTFAGEQVTNDKEKKVWTGFLGSVGSQAGLVYVLEKKRWCKTGVTIVSAKLYALFGSAFPCERENGVHADKWWQKLAAFGAGSTMAFHATKRLGPVWGLVIGNLVAGVPVRV